MRPERRAQAVAFILFFVAVLGCKSSGNSNTSNKPASSSSGISSSSSNNNAAASSSTAPATHANIAGKYTIVGTNPNNTMYRGALEVIEHGDVYQFRWNAGNQYDGVGVVNGDVV